MRPTPTEGTPLALSDPFDWIPTAPPATAPWPGVAAGTRFVVRRGDDCGPIHHIRFSPRRVRKCKAEQRWQGVVQGDGRVTFRPLPSISPKLEQLPAELALQWRVCPYKSVEAMEVRGSPWVAYEDQQVGRCYLWRPLDGAAWERIAKQVRSAMFDDLHPYVRDSMRELAVRAAAVGIEIRAISTYSKPSVQRDKPAKGKKKKKRYRHRGGRYSYMHSWGLAVDLTVGWKKPLYYPDSRYHRGSEVWRTFRTLGGWAEEMGFVWLGATMRGELVHFEFHPTTWGTIDGPDLTELLRRYRRGGIQLAHTYWHYDPSLASPFGALRDDGWTADSRTTAP
jgi:hypothetical protein